MPLRVRFCCGEGSFHLCCGSQDMVLSKKGTLGKSLHLYAFEGPSHSDTGTLVKQKSQQEHSELPV